MGAKDRRLPTPFAGYRADASYGARVAGSPNAREDLERVLRLVIGHSTFRGRAIPVTCRDRGCAPTAKARPLRLLASRGLQAMARRKIDAHVRTAPGQGLNAIKRLGNGALGVLGLANGEREGGARQRMRHLIVVGPVGQTAILPPMRPW